MARNRFLAAAARAVAGGLVGRRARAAKPVMDRPAAWNPVAAVAVRAKSGERVNETSALGISTYWACLTGIAADVAKVPVAAVQRLEPRGRRVLYDDPATVLLDEAFNDEVDAFTGRETLTGWSLGWGNGFAIIERDGRDRPVAMYPTHPSRVVVRRDEADRRVYLVRTDEGRWVPILDQNMFHLRGYGTADEGLSVFGAAAESLGLALASQTFAAKFYGGGLSADAVVALKEPLGDKEFAEFKTSLRAAYAGPDADRIFISNGDATVQRIGINPDDAQALEARQFSVPEVCRWFRRSPQKVGHDGQGKGWGTIDALNIADVNDCLMPWWVRWEKQAKRKLLAGSDRRVCVKHWVQALMRGENAARATYLDTRVKGGSLTPNEVREIEDEEPLDTPGADELWMQGAMAPISRLSAAPAPAAPPASPFGADALDQHDAAEDGEPDPVEPAPPAQDPEARAAEIALPAFTDAACRVVGKECAAVSRAMGKRADGFSDWAAKFYADQRSYVTEAFAAPVAVFAAAAGRSRDAALAAVRAYADGLWPDAVARTAEAFRIDEPTLAAALADGVLAACRAAKE